VMLNRAPTLHRLGIQAFEPVLVEGKAKVFKTLPNGKSSLLSFYNSLGVIGDLEFINEEVASGTLQALSSCNCLAIPIDIARVKLINDCKFLRFSCLR
ncbi:cyclic nucleotide-binding domain-containing protein, partial [Alistipes putredinis]|nr:cyclic nucleotide-binding domain-containing protein [Alistipes putredinis]